MDQKTASGSQRLVKTIRLDDERVGKLLDGLEANAGTPPDCRRGARYRYRIKTLVVHMQQPGFATPVSYLVVGRNISTQGLAFLHGGYVHTNTRCLVQLITSYGTWNDVSCTVVRCRYIEGNIHEVVVKFDEMVNPAVYCAEAVESRVLLVDDNPVISKLATFYLRELNAHADCVQSGEEALEKIEKEAYDVVLLDIEMPGLSGFDVAKELRQRGYSGIIVAATGLTGPGDAERCIAVGCDKYLPKPYTRNDLSALLGSLRQEPLFSTFHDHPEMKGLVRMFVGELPVRLRALEEAVIKQDIAKLQYLCRCLKGEGTGYGFEIISEAAAKVETSLLAGQALSMLHKDVNALIKLCMQARAAVRSGETAETQTAEGALDAALPPKEPPHHA